MPSKLGPHTLSPARECCSSALWVQGGGTLACEGVGAWGGGGNSDEGTDTLELYVSYNPSSNVA
jgi:hypothetical protein